MTFCQVHRPTRMRLINLAIVIFASVAPLWSQAGQLKTTDAVLDQYKHALGGVDAIKKVQSETMRGEIKGTRMTGKATFVYYAKPFKTLLKVRRANGTEVILDLMTAFHGPSVRKERASTKIPPSKRCAGMPTCNMRSTSPTISKPWTSAESPILKGATATGYTAPPIGARTIISSTM